jgi:DNA-binding response OmpR family regulator
MHALIIEDELLLASIIHEVLQDLGYTSFHFARTEVEALALFEQRRPDLITADVQLRLGSGVGAVMAICCEDIIPVVFVTARPAAVLKRLPGAIVVGKPFEIHSVVAAVEKARETRCAFMTI